MKNINNKLINLAKLHVELIEKGGPEFDGELFENLLREREIILKEYGLPERSKYIKLLEFDKLPKPKKRLSKD